MLVLAFNAFTVTFFVPESAYSTVILQIFKVLRNGYTPMMAVAAITFLTVSIVMLCTVALWGGLPCLMGADQSRN